METNPFLSAGTHVPTHIPSHDIPDLSPLTLQVLPNASFALQFIVNKGKIIGGGGEGDGGVCLPSLTSKNGRRKCWIYSRGQEFCSIWVLIISRLYSPKDF